MRSPIQLMAASRAPSVERAGERATPVPRPGPRPIALLHVEDSARDAELIRAHLEEAGLTFTLERVDGEAAFREALGRQRFDLILADFRVPGFEGTRTLELARQLCPDTPLLFVSGALGEERAVDLLKRGATDYVLKDNLARLTSSVERALDEVREREERRSAQEALRRSEERLRRVVEATSAGTWEMDLATNEVLPDPLLRGLFGLPWDVQRFPLSAVLARVHAQDRPAVEAAIAAAFAGQNGGRYVAEFRALGPAGKDERWVEGRGQVFFDAGGRPVRFLGTGVDITARKASEEERRRRAEFEQQLIGIVSHDLRSPLQTILLGTQMLLRRDELDARTVKAVNRIQTATERAARMVRDLLDFTRARLGGGLPLVRGAVDLHQVAHGVVAEAQAAHPERVLVVEARGEGTGEWDGDRLTQLLTNLVANAVAYSPPDTPVSVRTAGAEAEAEVVLEVHNAGAPIPSALLPHLFEPLTRGVEGIGQAERSVGLGLYIVDQVVRAHGGSISVRSTAEAGTTFTVRLPRRPPAPPAP